MKQKIAVIGMHVNAPGAPDLESFRQIIQEGREVVSFFSDEELDAEMVAMADRMGTTPGELRRQLDTAGRTGAVRSELRKGKALQWLLDHVELFDEDGNPMSRDDLKTDAAQESEEDES